MSKSYWALGAKDARLGLSKDYTRHLTNIDFDASRTYTGPWYSPSEGYTNGYDFAKDQMTRERVAASGPARKPDPSFWLPPQRFIVQTYEGDEGYLPGDYFFVKDTRTGLKVSRYVRRYTTAADKAYRYNVKSFNEGGGVWPEVGRVRELIDSRYVVPTFYEKARVQLYVVLYGSHPDAEKAQRQLKLWAHREKVAKRERQLLKNLTFYERYATGPKKFAAFSKPSSPREFRSDYGDVRPESTGEVYPWIVVGIDNPSGEVPPGLYWYVQSPEGEQVTTLTPNFSVAYEWAAGRKKLNRRDERPVSQTNRRTVNELTTVEGARSAFR